MMPPENDVALFILQFLKGEKRKFADKTSLLTTSPLSLRFESLPHTVFEIPSLLFRL